MVLFTITRNVAQVQLEALIVPVPSIEE